MTTLRAPRLRPLAWVLMGLVRLYRLIPRMGPGRCRFYPSCSAYALEALRIHGAVGGLWLALRRLGRCHPWNIGGIDRVPAQASEAARPAGSGRSTD